ncbi:MAG: hypothetical protein Phog2KO_31790 [Phototrophicaceae bacterium]
MTAIRFETENGIVIDCPEQAIISLGRRDDANHQQIDIDLAQLGEHGVSRLHAFIYITDKGCFIEDFNSRNGTVLNHYHLIPLKRYLLQSDDKLKLGRIEVTVHVDS